MNTRPQNDISPEQMFAVVNGVAAGIPINTWTERRNVDVCRHVESSGTLEINGVKTPAFVRSYEVRAPEIGEITVAHEGNYAQTPYRLYGDKEVVAKIYTLLSA